MLCIVVLVLLVLTTCSPYARVCTCVVVCMSLCMSLCCDSDKAVCESCSLAKVALHGPGTEHVRVCDTCADVFLSASLQGFSI